MMKRLIFCISIILTAIAFLAGCPNIDTPPAPPEFEGEWLTAFVEIDSESVEKSYSKRNSSRSAMPSELKDVNGKDLIFASVIYNGANNGTFSDSDLDKCEFDSTSNSLKIPFEKSSENRTNYTLAIYAYKGDYNFSGGFSKSAALLCGATTVTILSNEISGTFGDGTDNGTIFLEPFEDSTENGEASLSVKIPSGYVLTCNDSTNFKSPSNSNTEEYTECTIETISGGIAKGAYTINLFIRKDASDSLSTIYAWTEIINIYPGMKTDYWNTVSINPDNPEGAIDFSTVSPNSTVFVRGASDDKWFTENGINAASGSDSNGNGSIAKPFATVQTALEYINNISDESEPDYKILVDGKITASENSGVADFSEFVDTPSSSSNIRAIARAGTPTAISITGLGTNKAEFQGNKNSVIIIPDGLSSLNLTLENIKITGGETTTKGAGIYIGGGTVTITKSEISGNTATSGDGGAIYNGGNLTITDSEISGNAATDGDGGAIYNSGTITITDSEISGNAATDGDGGAIYNGGTLTITKSEISKNKVDGSGDGGAIYNDKGTVTISGGSISENSVTSDGEGSGVYNKGTFNLSGSLTFENDVYLSSGTKITITGNISGNSKIEIKPEDYLNKDAELITFNAGVTISGDINDTFSVKSSKVDTVTIDWTLNQNGTLHRDSGIDTVYLDSTVSSSGFGSVSSPVKTLAEVCGLLDFSADSPKIVIKSPYTLPSSEICLLDFSGKVATDKSVAIERYYGGSSAYCSGDLITIQENFGTAENPITLKNVTLDGNWKTNGGSGTEQFSSNNGALLKIGSGSYVKIDSNSVLKNNRGGGIYNGGTVTISSGTVSNNTADNGGAIQNEGTLTILSGEISENSAENGGAIYNNGTLELCSDAKISSDNDIFLASNGANGVNPITLMGNLAATETDVRISLPTECYKVNTQVLQSATKSESGTSLSEAEQKSLISNNYKKFMLNEANNSTSICKDFIIKIDSTGKNGVLATVTTSDSVALPGKYTFTLKKNSETLGKGGSANANDVLTFSVVDDKGNAPTATNYKIAVKQNGTEIPSLTKSGANVSDATVTISQKLAETAGSIDVYMAVTIDGKVYDATVTIMVEKPN